MINEILQWIAVLYIIYVLLNLSNATVKTRSTLKTMWYAIKNTKK